MASITRSHRSSMFFFRFLVVPFLHIQRKQGQHPPQHLFASNTYHLHETAAEVTPTYPVHTKGGILITGASTGIGLHAAQHLSALGFRVYAGVRSSKAAEQVKQAGGEDFLGRKGKGKQCRMNCGGWTLWTHFFVFVCICFDLFIFLEVEHDLVEMLAGGWDLKSDCRSSMTVRHKTLPQKIHQWLAGDLVPVILDVTLESTVQSAYETITKDLEQHALMLVGLVNCAGLSRCKNSTQKTTPRKKSSPAFSRCFNSPGGFCSHPFSKTPVFPPGVYHWNWNLWRWSKTFMKSPGDFWEMFWAKGSTQMKSDRMYVISKLCIYF